MDKRKLIVIFMVMTVTMLFAFTEVIAFNDNFDEEILDSVEVGPFTITLESIGDEGPPYLWTYKITKSGEDDLTGLNSLSVLIPDCWDQQAIGVALESGFDRIFPFAEGASDFAEGVLGTVIRGVSDDTATWSFKTNTNTKTMALAMIKYGKPNDPANSFRMPAPGCAELPCEELPDVRVEPVVQCYQFSADSECGGEGQIATWAIRWDDPNVCDEVTVWAEYGNEWGCAEEVVDGVVIVKDVKVDANLVSYDELEDRLELVIDSENSKAVTSMFSVDKCDTAWLRALQECENERCYKIGGRLYCR